MTGSHSGKIAELKPDDLRVHFSPELKRHFARLEAAVCESKHFAPEILWIVQDMAEGKSSTVRSTILGVAAVVQEAGKYIYATGDEKVEELLTAIIEALTPSKDGPDPVTVVGTPAKEKGRGG